MSKFNFADRYAESGLAPTAQVIASRQAPAERIVEDATNTMILDLVGAYYGSPDLDLTWFRDEFAADDASFSLVNNERETRVLAAAIVGTLVVSGNEVAILAVLAGGVGGLRQPTEATWLVREATSALLSCSVSARKPVAVETKVAGTAVTKLADEIAGVSANDWATLLQVLGKVRNEAQSSAKTTSSQTTAALTALNQQVRYMREESQMLWWLFSGHSRSLQRAFASMGSQQAALVGAVDLGELTSASRLGPVAAPAMIERVVALARKPKGTAALHLANAVDGLSPQDLERLHVFDGELPARLAPVTAAIGMARTMGVGAWHGRFRDRTGLEATSAFDAVSLGEQLYREHLLGQLL